jgi:aspartokinase-like uncharacterized kinase
MVKNLQRKTIEKKNEKRQSRFCLTTYLLLLDTRQLEHSWKIIEDG